MAELLLDSGSNEKDLCQPIRTFIILPGIIVKKAITIFLLFSLLITIGGYHLLYHIYKQGVKKEMKSYLAAHKDTRYGSYFSFFLSGNRISDPSFQWEDNQNEFRLHGELYDVVSSKKDGDSIRICAIKDTKENNLEKKVAELHRNKGNKDSDKALYNLTFFSLYSLFPEESSPVIQSFSVSFSAIGVNKLIPIYIPILSPPPRV